MTGLNSTANSMTCRTQTVLEVYPSNASSPWTWAAARPWTTRAIYAFSLWEDVEFRQSLVKTANRTGSPISASRCF